MIRINLYPEAKRAAARPASSGSQQLWVGIYFAGLVVWGVVLGGVYFTYQGRLEEQQRKNQALQVAIEELQQKSAGLDEVRAKLERSRQLEAVVADLNRARTGPTRALLEMSRILSEGGGPTIDPVELDRLRQENPRAGYNRSWDVRRLWLTGFEEESRECHVHGLGRTNEDVAEFLNRLQLSDLFDQVTLQKTEASRDNESGLALISFELTCRVTY